MVDVRSHRRSAERSPPRSRGLVVVMALVAAAAAIAGLVLTGMKDKAIYSRPVDELVLERSRFVGRAVRVEGDLVHGTLAMREAPCEYRFSMRTKDVTIPVHLPSCIVPDSFRDRADIDLGLTVEGALLADNTFEATNVLTKCPTKYDMKERAARGEKMPHALGPTEFVETAAGR
jgi:cytochrome c-type biogenesis protein CcmE